MVLDLSYMNERPSKADEKAIEEAVEKSVLASISNYLNEVADTMEAQEIESINVPTLRAMAQQFAERLKAAQANA